MRKKIILALLFLAIIPLIYFGVDFFITKEKIIQSGINLGLSLLLVITFSLLWIARSVKKSIQQASAVLASALTILTIISFISPTLIPGHWNIILALVVLLSGLSLIGILNSGNIIANISIFVLVVLLEVIVLFKIEESLFFLAGITMLIIASLLSLLAVFSKQ